MQAARACSPPQLRTSQNKSTKMMQLTSTQVVESGVLQSGLDFNATSNGTPWELYCVALTLYLQHIVGDIIILRYIWHIYIRSNVEARFSFKTGRPELCFICFIFQSAFIWTSWIFSGVIQLGRASMQTWNSSQLLRTSQTVYSWACEETEVVSENKTERRIAQVESVPRYISWENFTTFFRLPGGPSIQKKFEPLLYEMKRLMNDALAKYVSGWIFLSVAIPKLRYRGQLFTRTATWKEIQDEPTRKGVSSKLCKTGYPFVPPFSGALISVDFKSDKC